MKHIAVFAGASASINPEFNEKMFQTGRLLAENNKILVFGIGDEGMMGTVYRGVRSLNGKVLGITTPELLKLQCKNPKEFAPEEMEVVATLSIRKAKMFEAADALLIGPGGWGTLDELAEYCVLTQVGQLPKKPVVFLNFNGFWSPMKEMIRVMLDKGTVNPKLTDFIAFTERPEDVPGTLKKLSQKIKSEAS